MIGVEGGHMIEEDLGKLDSLYACLLYTSDAADERSSVDLGGRRIIKKKNKWKHAVAHKQEKNAER